MHAKPMETPWKPHVEMSPTCPRCGSANTKFCYYNNSSLTQPRYFCKGCRRYWTKGGSLRNVPVGGGCRKSRRGKPFSDVISVPPRVVSSGAKPDVVALGSSPVTIPILCPSTNGSSLTSPDQGSNIDLALVYANFLNPVPRSNEAENFSPPTEIPMLPNFNAVVAGAPSFQFPTPLLSQENGFVDQCRPLSFQSPETLLTNASLLTNAFFLSGLDSIEKQMDCHYHHHHQFISSMDNRININYGLPPLPGEELNTVVSEGLFWSGINDFIFPSQTPHATSSELSGIEEPPQAAEAPAPKRLRTESGNQLNVPVELHDLFRL